MPTTPHSDAGCRVGRPGASGPLGHAQEGGDPGALAPPRGRVPVQQLGGAQLPPPQQLVELPDRVYGSASWIALTTKKPSRASGALARARSCVSPGRGTSSRILVSSSTPCAVGGIG